jgi:hypothetical protein
MRNLPVAQLILVLLILVLGLVDLLARSVRKRASEQQPPPPPDLEDEYDVVSVEPLPESSTVPAPARARTRAAETLPPVVRDVDASRARPPALPHRPTIGIDAPPRERTQPTRMTRRRRWISLDPRQARRAIVLMEIFGPCRAAVPPREPM